MYLIRFALFFIFFFHFIRCYNILKFDFKIRKFTVLICFFFQKSEKSRASNIFF